MSIYSFGCFSIQTDPIHKQTACHACHPQTQLLTLSTMLCSSIDYLRESSRLCFCLRRLRCCTAASSHLRFASGDSAAVQLRLIISVSPQEIPLLYSCIQSPPLCLRRLRCCTAASNHLRFASGDSAAVQLHPIASALPQETPLLYMQLRLVAPQETLLLYNCI